MTTICYDRTKKILGADSRNTDSAGQVFETKKIEKLGDGRFFMGSGHCLSISAAKFWAEHNFDGGARPEIFDELIRGDNPEEYDFSCIIVSKDGNRTWIIDSEETPMEVFDDYLTLGSGGPYARGALAAGADMAAAINIAIMYDGNSSGPIHIYAIEVPDNEDNVVPFRKNN